jgi:hypothetical protein
MATLPKTLAMTEPAVHTYYAEANVLSADLKQPLEEEIKARAYVKLPKDGTYQFKKADPFRFEGIVSFQSGYTQVAGHPSSKIDGFTTLATSVLEGLNVLDVVTADRVVAQISTVHPIYDEGQVPSVTFLGTRFENLRIGGHKIEVARNLDILGPKPAGDKSYFDDDGVRSRVTAQYNSIATAKNLPEWASEAYPQGRAALNGGGELDCSVVDGITGAPGTSFGHVIDLPHFGKIFLGELKVEREMGNPNKGTLDTYKFHLTMIRLDMGCLAKGSAKIVALDANGKGQPPPKTGPVVPPVPPIPPKH